MLWAVGDGTHNCLTGSRTPEPLNKTVWVWFQCESSPWLNQSVWLASEPLSLGSSQDFSQAAKCFFSVCVCVYVCVYLCVHESAQTFCLSTGYFAISGILFCLSLSVCLWICLLLKYYLSCLCACIPASLIYLSEVMFRDVPCQPDP